jgi:hypothetical protein
MTVRVPASNGRLPFTEDARVGVRVAAEDVRVLTPSLPAAEG